MIMTGMGTVSKLITHDHLEHALAVFFSQIYEVDQALHEI